MEELTRDVSVSTAPDRNTEISELKKKINLIEEEKMVLQKKQVELLEQYCFRLSSICNDDSKVAFYAGFPNYKLSRLASTFWDLLSTILYIGTQETD